MIVGVELRVVGTSTSSPVFIHPLHLMSTNLPTLIVAEISVIVAVEGDEHLLTRACFNKSRRLDRSIYLVREIKKTHLYHPCFSMN